MNKAITIFCIVLSGMGWSGCQTDSSTKTGVETISVSDQLSAHTLYNIDLTREDALFDVAPGLDMSRLTVTCPTRATMSFTQYVDNRIRPTGAAYNPARDDLQLANSVVLQQISTSRNSAFDGQCECTCGDDAGGGESCSCTCTEI